MHNERCFVSGSQEAGIVPFCLHLASAVVLSFPLPACVAINTARLVRGMKMTFNVLFGRRNTRSRRGRQALL